MFISAAISPTGIVDMEIKFEAELTPEGREILLDMVKQFPDECPACGYSHPAHTWIRREGVMECYRCRYEPEDSDMWPSILEN